MSLKNPVTPPGIDPGTVRLVAQRLNHYANPGPSGRVISSSQRPLPGKTQHSHQTNIHAPVGFEPTISASEGPQIYALDRAAIGTGQGIFSTVKKLRAFALRFQQQWTLQNGAESKRYTSAHHSFMLISKILCSCVKEDSAVTDR